MYNQGTEYTRNGHLLTVVWVIVEREGGVWKMVLDVEVDDKRIVFRGEKANQGKAQVSQGQASMAARVESKIIAGCKSHRYQ